MLLTPGQLWCPKPIPVSLFSLPIGSQEIDSEKAARPQAQIVDEPKPLQVTGGKVRMCWMYNGCLYLVEIICSEGLS